MRINKHGREVLPVPPVDYRPGGIAARAYSAVSKRAAISDPRNVSGFHNNQNDRPTGLHIDADGVEYHYVGIDQLGAPVAEFYSQFHSMRRSDEWKRFAQVTLYHPKSNALTQTDVFGHHAVAQENDFYAREFTRRTGKPYPRAHAFWRRPEIPALVSYIKSFRAIVPVRTGDIPVRVNMSAWRLYSYAVRQVYKSRLAHKAARIARQEAEKGVLVRVTDILSSTASRVLDPEELQPGSLET